MKALFLLVKYMPVVCGWILTIHCALLVQGEDSEILKEFFSFSWEMALIMTMLSYKLGMCVYHRLFIWYDLLLDLCIKGQRYGIFSDMGIDVQYARYIALSLGIIIQILLIYRLYGSQCRTRGSHQGA